MERHLLSGIGKRMLCSVFVCCLYVCVVPANARAQASFTNANCSLLKVTVNGQPAWSIRGTVGVTGLDPKDTSATVTFKFQKKAKGADNWTDLLTVEQTTNGFNGTANFDSGPQSTPPPNSGDQYQVRVNGFYKDNTGNSVNIPGIVSTPPVVPVQ